MSASTAIPLTIDAPPIECIIRGTEIQEYSLSLAAGQFVAITAMQNGADVMVEVYNPDGTARMKVDSTNGAYGTQEALVTAEADGTYRVVIRPWEQSGPGIYSIVARSANQFTAEKAKIKSPRLLQLWKALFAHASGGSEVVTQFIQERKEAKEPLIEAIPGDDSQVLATFVYQGDVYTRSVTVAPAPAVDRIAPMERFADTDLWTVSLTIPNDTRLFYGFLVRKAVPPESGAENHPLHFSEDYVPDPWNPTRSLTDDPFSQFVLPAAPAQPYADEPAPGTLRGRVEQREVYSTILNEKRPYTVYTPSDYDPNRKGGYGVLLVVYDGQNYTTKIPTPTILDNLMAANKIPPMMAVIVHYLKARIRDLSCNALFVDFLARELLPAVRAEFPGATSNAERTIAAGLSLGGLCAAYCGLTHPETFGNVLSQSGSFWYFSGWEKECHRQRDNVIPPEGAIHTAFLKSERLPVRFYLEVGTFEHAADQLRPNRHLRDILLLKGYDVTYSEFHGGHDFNCWRGSLADGLLMLTRDWRRYG